MCIIRVLYNVMKELNLITLPLLNSKNKKKQKNYHPIYPILSFESLCRRSHGELYNYFPLNIFLNNIIFVRSSLCQMSHPNQRKQFKFYYRSFSFNFQLFIFCLFFFYFNVNFLFFIFYLFFNFSRDKVKLKIDHIYLEKKYTKK